MYGAGVEPRRLLLRQCTDLLYQLCMIQGDDCAAFGGMDNEWPGKPKYSEKTCRSAALSATDPT
jgi:hypothetical protein